MASAQTPKLNEREAIRHQFKVHKNPDHGLKYYPPQRRQGSLTKCLISGLVLEKATSWIRACYDRDLKCLHERQTTKLMRSNLESGHWSDMGEHEHENNESY